MGTIRSLNEDWCFWASRLECGLRGALRMYLSKRDLLCCCLNFCMDAALSLFYDYYSIESQKSIKAK